MGANFRVNSAGLEAKLLEVPFDAHQEQVALAVLVLVGVQDVGIVPVQEFADGGNDPLAVGTVDQQDGGVLHGSYSAPLDPPYFFAAGQTTRPGVVVRMLYSVPPPVMYSVFRSSPPNAQLVTSSFGTGRKASSLPSGLST